MSYENIYSVKKQVADRLIGAKFGINVLFLHEFSMATSIYGLYMTEYRFF